MNVALIGVGRGGGKITDRFIDHANDASTEVFPAAIAIDSMEANLLDLKRVQRDRRVLVGYDRLKGHGVGADPELGEEVVREDIDAVQEAINTIPAHEIDAFLIVAALGGGTGSGGAPVVAKHLKRVYADPVYGLGVLPASDEGGIYTRNAAQSLARFREQTDGLLLFDNDAWAHDEDDFEAVNEQPVAHVTPLFEGTGGTGNAVMDTLENGDVASVGHADEEVERESTGVLSGVFGSNDGGSDAETDRPARILRLVRAAAIGGLTFPTELSEASQAALVVTGPPEALDSGAIREGRDWLEARYKDRSASEARVDTREMNRSRLDVSVLLSGLADPDRLNELRNAAEDAKKNLDEIREQSSDNLEELVDEDDELGDSFKDDTGGSSTGTAQPASEETDSTPSQPPDSPPPQEETIGKNTRRIIGVDFGASCVRCAVFRGGHPQTLRTGEGHEETPTVVSIKQSGEMLAGREAVDQIERNPERTITDLTRRLDEDDAVNIDGVEYPPETLAAAVLAKALPTTSFGSTPNVETVIAVPNRATSTYRRNIRTAAEILGTSVGRLCTNTAGAAMAYGLDDESDQTVLVFDLGGGTFDVSILDLGSGVYEVVTTNGDNDLGGDDWDEAIVDWLADEFENEHGIDLREDPQTLQQLREAAEEAKIELSNCKETNIDLPFITTTDDGPVDLKRSITRAKFESITSDLLKRVEDPTEQALADAGYSEDDTDEVILVGGSTRMPMVQDKVEELTGKEPKKNVNPDEAVALGAAIQGGVLAGEVDDIILLDVTLLSLGIEVKGGLFERLIEKNTTIPVEESKVFTTAVDNQTSIQVRVFQGEREISEENELLGEFMLTGIPPVPAGTPQIKVSFKIDADGILKVSAEDKGSGESEEITVHHKPRLSEPAMVWSRWLVLGPAVVDAPVLDEPPDSLERIRACSPDRMYEPSQPIASDVGEPPPIPVKTLPHSVGVEIAEGEFEQVLEKGTTIPTSASHEFTTSDDNQESVQFSIYQGEGDTVDDKELIGGFTLENLPPAPAGTPQIEVTFDVDQEGILWVEAIEDTVGTTESEKFHIFDYSETLTEFNDDVDADAGPDDDQSVTHRTADTATNQERRVDERLTHAEINQLLEVRDDLTRALTANTDTPDDIQDGLRATKRKISESLTGEVSDPIATDLAAVSDDIERAIHNNPRNVSQLQQWLKSMRQRVDNALTTTGVRIIDPEPGTETDPERHKIVDRVQSSQPSGTVSDVRQAGYELAGSIEQPASVTVSNETTTDDSESDTTAKRVPETIPSVPRTSLVYDDLEETELIGSGGSAEVYRAKVQVEDDTTQVAVKKPHLGGTLHTETVERILDEAEKWKRLDGDYVVSVVDYGSEPLPWIAMEFMDGGHLGERADEMPFEQALWTAIGITKAIRYAFSKNGVVHLDLKPENILFREVKGAWDVPKVADWGLSKHLHEHSQSVEGLSPRYAAPEQFAPEEFGSPDNATDVYQLGAVFYELFTRRPPFEGGQFEVMRKIENEEPTPPSDVADLPADIDEIILTAMAKDKSERYEDALLLRNALQDLFESV
jgi:molecular chaperone DnaK